MEEVGKAVATTLLGYGLPGVVILGLCVMVYLQRQDIAAQREELKGAYESRRNDALAWQQLVRDNTEAMLKIRDATVPEITAIKTELRETRLIRRPRDEISSG